MSMNRILNDMWTAGYRVSKRENCVIQKRVAYFDCIAVLDGSYAALSHVGLPSSSLLA